MCAWTGGKDRSRADTDYSATVRPVIKARPLLCLYLPKSAAHNPTHNLLSIFSDVTSHAFLSPQPGRLEATKDGATNTTEELQ